MLFACGSFLVFFATTNRNTAMLDSAESCKLQWAIERPWSEGRTIYRGSCQFFQRTILWMMRKAWAPMDKGSKKLNRNENKADDRPQIHFAVCISFWVHPTGFSRECMAAILEVGVWVLCRSGSKRGRRLKEHVNSMQVKSKKLNVAI